MCVCVCNLPVLLLVHPGRVLVSSCLVAELEAGVQDPSCTPDILPVSLAIVSLSTRLKRDLVIFLMDIDIFVYQLPHSHGIQEVSLF